MCVFFFHYYYNMIKHELHYYFFINQKLFDFMFYLDLDILTLQTRWQTLSQLISLLRIFHTKSVQVLGTTDFKLGTSRTLTDLNHLGILATGLLEEVANIGDLLGHGWKKKR